MLGICKVRNEIETKRNSTKRNETERNETKSNKTKHHRTKRNETKCNGKKPKRNQTKRKEAKPIETKRNVAKKKWKIQYGMKTKRFIIYWLSKFRRLKGFPVLYYNDYPNLLYLSIFFSIWNFKLLIELLLSHTW